MRHRSHNHSAFCSKCRASIAIIVMQRDLFSMPVSEISSMEVAEPRVVFDMRLYASV